MTDTVLQPAPARQSRVRSAGATAVLAVFLGVVMPVVSAIAFPTYMHKMPIPSWEWARLLETPYVVFEIAVILWASHSGMDRASMFRALPRDVQIAFAPFVIGIFASSVLISSNPSASLTMSLITVIHVMFALAVFHLFMVERGRQTARFLDWHGLGLAVLTLYTAWWFAFPPPAETVMGGVIEWRSALPGFINVRHFGAWTGAIAAAFAVQILFVKPHGWHRDHAFYFLAATLTVWSGTRAALLAIIVVVPLFVLFQRQMPPLSSIAKASFLTLAALGTAWLFAWDADGAFLLFEEEDFQSLDSVSSQRTLLWAKAFELWTQSPLLGWGTGSFFWEGKPWSHTQPHNVIVQFLASWGLVGAIGGFWLIGRGIGFTHKAAMGHTQSLGLLAMLYALLFQSLLEGMLHYPRFIVSIIVLSALILAQSRGSDRHAAPGA